MDNKQHYKEAFEELQKIVREIEEGEITIDVLSEKVKRAAQLIGICRSRLTETEQDVSAILKELEERNNAAL